MYHEQVHQPTTKQLSPVTEEPNSKIDFFRQYNKLPLMCYHIYYVIIVLQLISKLTGIKIEVEHTIFFLVWCSLSVATDLLLVFISMYI